MNYIEKVTEFHQVFNHPVLLTPQIPDDKRANLRVRLITEELEEFRLAVQRGDMIEAADALADLQYVLSGTILEFGLAKKFDEIFTEVHRSNMSKACESEAEALQTIAAYKEIENTDAYYKEVAGAFLVYRKSDNKTLKSVNYSPADIQSILIK